MGELQKIPGVGKATEKSLIMLGYTTIKSLKDANPAQMYEKECLIRGQHIDRCQLYVYRCAVYFASTENPSGGIGKIKKSKKLDIKKS